MENWRERQESTDERDTGSFSVAESYVLFSMRVRVYVCAYLCVYVCVCAYLFRKIDSLLMLRAATRLPWLMAKYYNVCACV